MSLFKWLLISLLIYGVCGGALADPPLPSPVGRVVWVKGTLKAVMENKEVRILQKTSVIYLHDTLTTDNNSQAQIVFTDNTLLTFRPDSKFFIDQYIYKPAQKKSNSLGKYVMDLIQGGFRTITGLIAKKNPSDFQINTPVATIGVRGTDFAVVLRGNELLMAQYGGAPCINNNKGAKVCLSSQLPYGSINGLGGQPLAFTQQPPEFREKLRIEPASIQPFSSGVNSPSPRQNTGGVITNFCITQ